MLFRATITIGIPPTFHVGPVSLAWHGLMIVLGILAGGWLALRYAERFGLRSERLRIAIVVLALSGMLGARLYYLLQTDPSALLSPSAWRGRMGYAFYGAILLGVPIVAAYLWRRDRPFSYLDALAAGFPLGMAVGRIGDLINGEHYGPATTAPWGFRYTDPGAFVPSNHLAYQSGAFYEILLALGMLAMLWPLGQRLRTPGLLLCVTVAVYSAGRFLIFFIIRDTPVVALGLRQAQLTSLGLMVLAVTGAVWLARRHGKSAAEAKNPPKRNEAAAA